MHIQFSEVAHVQRVLHNGVEPLDVVRMRARERVPTRQPENAGPADYRHLSLLVHHLVPAEHGERAAGVLSPRKVEIEVHGLAGDLTSAEIVTPWNFPITYVTP